MRAQPDGNAAIEIHDSTLRRIESHGDVLVAVLSAYVHRSSGTPGVDRGSAWSQTARLLIGAGRATGTVARVPFWLASGQVQIAGETHENMIPVPLAHDGAIRIALCGFEGETVVLEGQSLNIVLLDDAEYVEEFPGSQDAGQ